LKDPVKYDVKYQVKPILCPLQTPTFVTGQQFSVVPHLIVQASAQPFLVLGLLVTALATSHWSRSTGLWVEIGLCSTTAGWWSDPTINNDSDSLEYYLSTRCRFPLG